MTMPLNEHDTKDFYVWLDNRLRQLAEDQDTSHARLRQDMNSGFSGVNTRLDALNGKTAIHTAEIAVLRDRSERAERQSGITGSITGGLAAGVVIAVKALIGSVSK